MPKKIDSALRDRAVRLAREHRSEYPSLTPRQRPWAVRSVSATSLCPDGCCKPILTMAPVTG